MPLHFVPRKFAELGLVLGACEDPHAVNAVNIIAAEVASASTFLWIAFFHCVTPSLSVVNIFTEHPDVIHISSSEHFVSEQSLFCGAENAALSLNKTVSVLSVGPF